MHSAELLKSMKDRLGAIYPEFEIEQKAELVEKILALKEQKGAVILGHNYMEAALFQFVPDFKGDSLELSRKAANTDGDPIVFCGVRFMAETAKILSPHKKVLIPSSKAGCSLAESISAEDVRELRRKYPGVPVVSYVNTYADVKAETDICCTSGNAAKVVESLGTDTVIFLPDEFLARNVAEETGRHIIFPYKKQPLRSSGLDDDKSETTLDKVMIGWSGICEVHEKFTADDVTTAKKQFPNVQVLAHPECSPEVCDLSDFSSSTSKMVNYVKNSKAEQFLILTECSMGDNIIAENPDKEILRLCSHRCPHMAEITLEDTLSCLKKDQYEIILDPVIMDRARASLTRMIAIG